MTMIFPYLRVLSKSACFKRDGDFQENFGDYWPLENVAAMILKVLDEP